MEDEVAITIIVYILLMPKRLSALSIDVALAGAFKVHSCVINGNGIKCSRGQNGSSEFGRLQEAPPSVLW